MDEGFQEFRNCQQKASCSGTVEVWEVDERARWNLVLGSARPLAKVPRHPQTFMLGELSNSNAVLVVLYAYPFAYMRLTCIFGILKPH